MRTSDSTLWRILKFFKLNKLYRWLIKDILPDSWNKKIAALTLENVFIPRVIRHEIEPRFKVAWKYLLKTEIAPGDYLEFGVAHGTSLACMHRVLSKFQLDRVRIFGFDSFEGLPPGAAAEDKGIWKPGEFEVPLEITTKYLNEHKINWHRTFLIKGWYEDTLVPEVISKYRIEKASVIMIDCDLYSSSKRALNFCIPVIKNQAVIFFDDWKEDEDIGEHKAYREFLEENPQFKSEIFGHYKPTGKIFLVTNTLYLRFNELLTMFFYFVAQPICL